MELKDRFLQYVSFDTQSSEASETYPSTDKQLVLLRHLADEMRALGLTEVVTDNIHSKAEAQIPLRIHIYRKDFLPFFSQTCR